MSPFVLATARLRVRYQGDVEPELFYRYLLENRDAHKPWEPIRGEAYDSLAAAEARREAAIAAHSEGRERRFALMSPDLSDVAGLVNFTNVVGLPFPACHLGFSIAKKSEGAGLMREGLRATIGFVFVFVEFALNRVMANFMPRNFRCARLLGGLNFRVEGFAKDYLRIDGKWEDHILTSVLRREWLASDSGHAS